MIKNIRTHATLLIAVSVFTFACGKQKKDNSTGQAAGAQALADAQKAAAEAAAAKAKSETALKAAQQELATLKQTCPGTQCAEEKAALEKQIRELQDQNAKLGGKSSEPGTDTPGTAPIDDGKGKTPPTGAFTPEATASMRPDFDGDVALVQMEVFFAKDPTQFVYMMTDGIPNSVSVFNYRDAVRGAAVPVTAAIPETLIHLGGASSALTSGRRLEMPLAILKAGVVVPQAIKITSGKSGLTDYIVPVLDKPISAPVFSALKIDDFKSIDIKTKAIKVKRETATLSGNALVPEVQSCILTIDTNASHFEMQTSGVEDKLGEDITLVFKNVPIVDDVTSASPTRVADDLRDLNNQLQSETILSVDLDCAAEAMYSNAKDNTKMVQLQIHSNSWVFSARQDMSNF